jgi:hypothetical protein
LSRAQLHEVSWLIVITKLKTNDGEGGTSGWIYIFNEHVGAHFRGMQVIPLLPKRWQTKVYCEVPVRVITQHRAGGNVFLTMENEIVNAYFLLDI